MTSLTIAERLRCRHRLWLGCCPGCGAVAYLEELGAQIRRNETRRIADSQVDHRGRPLKAGVDHHARQCRDGHCLCAYPGRQREAHRG